MRGEKSFDEGAGAIPEDLNSNADEQKRRETEDDVHPGGTHHRREAIGETVAEIDCRGDDRGSDDRGQNCDQVFADVVRRIGSEGDCGGDGTWTDGERQSERIKGAAENIGGIHIFLNLAALVVVFLFEHGPAIGNDDEAAADLHHRDRDAEEGEDVRADKIRGDDEDETVEGDAPGKEAAGLGGVVVGEGKKYRTAADRIDDRKEGTDDEKNTFCDFEQANLRGKSIAEGYGSGAAHATPPGAVQMIIKTKELRDGQFA